MSTEDFTTSPSVRNSLRPEIGPDRSGPGRPDPFGEGVRSESQDGTLVPLT